MTYTPLGSRSTAVILALYAKLGACALAIGADIRRILVAEDLEQGRVLVDELLAADQLVGVATMLEVVAFVVAAALFLGWQVAAHRNLPALGEREPRTGVAAGVAAWFVPVVNLLRPLRVVTDLWRAGERQTRPPVLLRVWWVAWLLALVTVVAAWGLLGEAVDVADRQRIDALRAAATALSGLAAALAIAVVSRATDRQERRAPRLGAPRAARAGDRESPGGLPVLSEEQARRPGS